MAEIPLKYAVPIIALAAIPLIYVGAGSLVASTETPVVPAQMSDQDIKGKAQQISYDAIAREPIKYKGTTVVFQGKVVQSLYENDKDVLLRVRVTEKFDDIVWVYYQRKSNDEPRILEKDTVRFWGEYTGIKSYKSVIGATLQVPRVVSHIVEPVAKEAAVK